MIFTLKKIPKLSWSSFDELNFKPKSNTLIYLIFGLILFGLGETLLVTANIGVSPWFVLHQGMSVKTGYSIGLTTLIVSIIVLFFWIPLKQKPGIGTILNTILISVVVDLSLPYLPHPEEFLSQLLQVIIAVLIVGLGSGFYLIANLGPGARDGLMTGIQKKTNLSFSLTRTLIELSAVALGWYLGGIVGIGTVIYALGIGPFVSFGLFFVGKYFK
ncbi:MAG: YitT family protein [Pelagibacteraceae bacterium]|nr:YitT family protein [Pelagibacteraceae bacterium]MBO6467228.1 YitT family protein [Pelagibacteraceae bacterium]MBO6471683.1 YitT family protein [Pelagibacteraceae bacterium]MBO6479245.1 YitT family protein [Pelagibacteraceae bacterium]